MIVHRDAIAEHNTARCYMAKGARLEQFPDVQPHPSVSAYLHVHKARSACEFLLLKAWQLNADT